MVTTLVVLPFVRRGTKECKEKLMECSEINFLTSLILVTNY